MLTGLTVILIATLFLFLSSLVFAVVEDWLQNRGNTQKFVADQIAHVTPIQRNFHRAARRPARVLGTYIF